MQPKKKEHAPQCVLPRMTSETKLESTNVSISGKSVSYPERKVRRRLMVLSKNCTKYSITSMWYTP